MLAALGLACRTTTGRHDSVSVPWQSHPFLRAERGRTGRARHRPPCSPQSFSSEPSLQSFSPSHSGFPLLTQSPLWQR